MSLGARVESPPAALLELLETREAPILSVFLAVSPEHPRSRAFQIAFADACKRVAPSVPPGEQEAFREAVRKVRTYLTREYTPDQHGLAVYAYGYGDSVYAVPLPYAPEDSAVWDSLPRLEPLRVALEQYERVAMVLFDKEHSRLFTVRLGKIEERRTIKDYVPRRQATGGWAALAQSHFARHREEHVRRHIERTIETMLALLRTHPFDRLFLAGPSEAVSALRAALPPQLEERLSGGFKLEMVGSEAQILDEVLDAAREAEQKDELDTVLELIESSHAVFGADATIEAIEDGRADTVFVAASLEGDVQVCDTCHRLVPHGNACSRCGGSTRRAPDLRQQVVDRALRIDAVVEIVSGEAATKLFERGGLGARLRY